MKTSINTRLAAFIEKKGYTNLSLSKDLKVSASAIGYIVGERQSKPSAEMLEKLGNTYPDLNLDWLVTGRGVMLHTGAKAADCWQLLESEQTRRQQLQADYDTLLARFQQQKSDV